MLGFTDVVHFRFMEAPRLSHTWTLRAARRRDCRRDPRIPFARLWLCICRLHLPGAGPRLSSRPACLPARPQGSAARHLRHEPERIELALQQRPLSDFLACVPGHHRVQRDIGERADLPLSAPHGGMCFRPAPRRMLCRARHPFSRTAKAGTARTGDLPSRPSRLPPACRPAAAVAAPAPRSTAPASRHRAPPRS